MLKTKRGDILQLIKPLRIALELPDKPWELNYAMERDVPAGTIFEVVDTRDVSQRFWLPELQKYTCRLGMNYNNERFKKISK